MNKINIKSNIKFLRESKGMKQSEFAKLFGLSRDNIASYERGTEPKLKVILQIVNFFHISIDDFVTENFSLNPPNTINSSEDKIAPKIAPIVAPNTKKGSVIDYPAFQNALNPTKLEEAVNGLIDKRIGDVESLLYRLLANMKAQEIKEEVTEELKRVDEMMKEQNTETSK